MNLHPIRLALAAAALLPVLSACNRTAAPADPASSSAFVIEQEKATTAREAALAQCGQLQLPAREDCLSKANAEYESLVAAAKDRRETATP